MKFQNFIGGQFLNAISGEEIDVFQPSTGKVYARVASSDKRDVDMAVVAAERAQKSWAEIPMTQRCEYLFRIADAIEKQLTKLAQIESHDQGKPIRLAQEIDIPRAASNFRFFAGAISQHLEQSSSMDGKAINYSLREPVGVAGLISPWNLPLYLLTWKIAPAIACGNTCVAKCSELTPATANALCEIFQEVNLPPGVVNLVHGFGQNVGRAMAAHPRIPLISFTGSTPTGLDIQNQSAPYFKKLSLELGGKNPNIIFADADLDLAVNESVRAAFTNQGEICLCGSRILVEDAIYNQFRDAFVAKTKTLVTGDPNCAKSDLGALVSASHRDKVMRYINMAVDTGGKLLCGGDKPILAEGLEGGYYLSPTVFEGLPQSSDVIQNEIFGPVVTLQSFSQESEALNMANDTAFGLSASIWTRDVSRAHRFSSGLKAGVIWVNSWMKRDLRTPFGGYKFSGVGREGGHHSIDFYTESKNVCISFN